MAETTEQKKERTRRPNARHQDVVFGAIEERLEMLDHAADESLSVHAVRLRELLDELKRSLGRTKENDKEAADVQ